MHLVPRVWTGAAIVLISLSGLLAGCANLDPKLVTGTENPPPEGLRFYMTRPFVAVHRPYPIQAEAYLVSANVSADGKYVQLTDIPEKLKEAVPTAKLTGTIPTGALLRATGGIEAQSDKEPGSDDKAQEATAKEPADDDAKKSAAAKVGYSNYTVTTDLAGVAIMPINDAFSIVYLPDYDREFVVETKGKLGITRLNLALGPGSTMLGMSGESDNTAWAKIVLDSIKSLATAGTDRLTGLIAAADTGAAAQSDRSAEYRKIAGESVTLRAYVIKMATIGLYPIAKPCEIASEGNGPTCIRKVENSGRKVVEPARPYQVPYEYYQVVLFEHVLSSEKPYLLTVESKPAASSNCEGKLPAAGLHNSSVALANQLRDQGVTNVRFSNPRLSTGCADVIKVTVITAGADKVATKAAVERAFSQKYPQTQPQVEMAE
jgi:hypothetical protein